MPVVFLNVVAFKLGDQLKRARPNTMDARGRDFIMAASWEEATTIAPGSAGAVSYVKSSWG
jgi:hypothetical protein